MKHRAYQNGHARSTRLAGQVASPHQQALARGLQHHQAGRLPEAEAIYRQVLAADPANAPALHLLGALANQVGQHAAAIELISQAIQIEPAAASYHNNLGVAHQNLGRLAEAVACYEQAIALQSDHVDALNNLGVAHQNLGQIALALAAFERSLKLRPNHPETLNNASVLLLALGRLDEAEARLRRALKLRPGYSDALTNLSGVMTERGRLDEALRLGQQAATLAPGDARAHDMLGTVLRAAGQIEESVASYRRALALRPESFGTWLNLAGTLQVAGQTGEAIEAYRRALALNPDSTIAHSGLIFSLDLQAGTHAEARTERQRWNARFGQVWQQRPTDHRNDPSPERRLRIGYVSADFFQHSASAAIMPILRAHDHTQVHVTCYSGVTRPDAITEEARALADAWHDVAYRSDDDLEALIRADAIDILVDLSGHSAGNRLPVFARKPAPIQATAWGYATGTGLDAIDAFLIDRVVVPPGEDDQYAERIVALPTPICLEIPADAPPVGPPPVVARGGVTFGAFNRIPKASAVARDAWARTLLAVPGSRLLVKTGPQDSDAARRQLVDDLVARGIGRERIELRGPTPRREHLAAHADVDIMLDTFPHTGGVTTAEALLMGVPMVTLLGEGIVGRLSASFLTALGLGDLAAPSVDAYVRIAAALAADCGRLARERGTLRGRLLASPIGDAQAYTRAAEAAYRDLWRGWCAGRAAAAE